MLLLPPEICGEEFRLLFWLFLVFARFDLLLAPFFHLWLSFCLFLLLFHLNLVNGSAEKLYSLFIILSFYVISFIFFWYISEYFLDYISIFWIFAVIFLKSSWMSSISVPLLCWLESVFYWVYFAFVFIILICNLFIGLLLKFYNLFQLQYFLFIGYLDFSQSGYFLFPVGLIYHRYFESFVCASVYFFFCD